MYPQNYLLILHWTSTHPHCYCDQFGPHTSVIDTRSIKYHKPGLYRRSRPKFCLSSSFFLFFFLLSFRITGIEPNYLFTSNPIELIHHSHHTHPHPHTHTSLTSTQPLIEGQKVNLILLHETHVMKYPPPLFHSLSLSLSLHPIV